MEDAKCIRELTDRIVTLETIILCSLDTTMRHFGERALVCPFCGYIGSRYHEGGTLVFNFEHDNYCIAKQLLDEKAQQVVKDEALLKRTQKT